MKWKILKKLQPKSQKAYLDSHLVQAYLDSRRDEVSSIATTDSSTEISTTIRVKKLKH